MREQLESPLKRITLIMHDKYDSWVKELEKEESEDCAKTIAMLKLHQVGALRARLTRQGYYRIRRRQVSQVI